MKIQKLSILLLLLLAGVSHSYSHALWIETEPTGKIGQPQQVKVFYGEYAQNERDSVSKWYSNTRDFTLWLIGPDKQKVQLKTAANPNFHQSSFTPDKEGVYTLMISHDAKDLGGTTKYVFLSSATVAVGKSAKASPIGNENALVVMPPDARIYKKGTPVTLNAHLNGQPASQKTVTIFSPKGWQMEAKTNDSGALEFIPDWEGTYMIEVTTFDKTKGEHEGKPYKAVWKGATHCLVVK